MKLTFLLLPLLIADYLWCLRGRKFPFSLKEVVLNLQCMVMRSFFSLYFTFSIFGYLVFYLHQQRIHTFSDTWWATHLIAFTFVDHQFYWKHRIAHTIPFLWLEHRIHHSSKEFHGLVSYRASYISNSLFFLLISPMAYIGISPWSIVFHIAISGVLQHLNHLGSVPRLKLIEKWIHTPWVHRAHHHPDKSVHGHNFGAALLVWDHLYGTFRQVKATDHEKIGIKQDLSFSENILITYFPFWKIPKESPKVP